jgi:hypothetical protein
VPYANAMQGAVTANVAAVLRRVVRAASTDSELDPLAGLFWEALDAHGGVMRPELVRRGGRLVAAGEYADVPARILRRTAKHAVDEVAQYVRDRGVDVTTSDVLCFFAEHPTRPRGAGLGFGPGDRKRVRAELRAIGVLLSDAEALALLEAAEREYPRVIAAAPRGSVTRRARRAGWRGTRAQRVQAAREEHRCTTCTGPEILPDDRRTCDRCVARISAANKARRAGQARAHPSAPAP